MVGFYKPYIKDMYKELAFTFPREIPLKKTMSDIFKGRVTKELNSKEERKVGFTLRVGGGKSPINDRRNWDGYIVNNKVVRLDSKKGLEMMGFPKSYKMPVTENQAMKQLGNSVAVNVVKAVGKEIRYYLETYSN
jgi:DNA (cytosine-5)-methyltransferase 1